MNLQPDVHEGSREAEGFGLQSLHDLLNYYSAILPVVEPIGEFIHYNTLQAFLGSPFEEALFQARNIYGARPYMPLAFYRSKMKDGAISREVLQRIVAKRVSDGISAEVWTTALEISHRLYDPSEVLAAIHDLHPRDRAVWNHIDQEFPLSFFKDASRQQSIFDSRRVREASSRLSDDGRNPLRDLWTARLGERVDRLVNPLFYRMLAGFLDQGVASWELPGTSETFFEAAIKLLFSGMIPDPGGIDFSKLSVHDSILAILAELVGDKSLWSTYLREIILGSPGWSSLVAQLARKGERLQQRRKIHLGDLVACSLLVEYAMVRGIYGVKDRISALLCGPDSAMQEVPFATNDPLTVEEARLIVLFDLFELARSIPGKMAGSDRDSWLHSIFPLLVDISDIDLERTWHEAFESTYYHSVLGVVVPRAKAIADNSKTVSAPLPKDGPAMSVQMIFCLDDRECSMRRYIEKLEPGARTYGMPGFFGIDMMFVGAGLQYPEKYCPVPMVPQHIVVEENILSGISGLSQSKLRRLKKGSKPRAILAPLRLFQVWMAPGWHAKSMRDSAESSATKIMFHARRVDATGKVPNKSGGFEQFLGYQLGYTHNEMADRIESALRSMGTTEKFAPLVLIVAHGSSAMNNPYYAAYDCAACSGRQGIPNARVFAGMANDPEVRKLLAARGILIPDGTRFVGCFHDTARDDFRFYDVDDLSRPEQTRSPAALALVGIRKLLRKAAGLNAIERCARFEKAPRNLTPRKALREVRLRATALFEPRAELGHATNAACVVGRREITAGLSLNRRSFLTSYDPIQDPDGRFLAGILGAAIPVCGGVNLDYFFSRVDNQVYGSGSKLSHNVVGMIGVANGVDDDLQTGLPSQMVELHDPVRLLFIIDQNPVVVRKVIDASPLLKNWVDHRWVRVCCADPDSGEVSFLDAKGIVPWTPGEVLP